VDVPISTLQRKAELVIKMANPNEIISKERKESETQTGFSRSAVKSLLLGISAMGYIFVLFGLPCFGISLPRLPYSLGAIYMGILFALVISAYEYGKQGLKEIKESGNQLRDRWMAQFSRTFFLGIIIPFLIYAATIVLLSILSYVKPTWVKSMVHWVDSLMR